VDSGDDVYYSDVQSSINTYYSLIARNYLGKGKTAADLVQNFVNKNGNRYASAQNYEKVLSSIISSVNSSSQSLITSYNKDKTSLT
jgi:flagellum-specific peptidoglycan hydrolase FlgJ